VRRRPAIWHAKAGGASAALCANLLLLLDEPAAGLNHGRGRRAGAHPQHRDDAFKTTILLVEHHMSLR
jgi:ABC-type branched-subunit amino acid transport system ATPase component